MSQTRFKINSQVEQSLLNGSVPVTNNINEQVYVNPLFANDILGFDGTNVEFRNANDYITFASQVDVDNGIDDTKPITSLKLSDTIVPIVTTGNTIATISNKEIKETVTSLTKNVNNTITYISENGTNTTFPYQNTQTIFLQSDLTTSITTMVPINNLTFNVSIGWYKVTFTPLYNVNATTTGTGWNFEGGTAVIQNYSFRSELPSTATANFVNNYVARNQNFTTTQTSRINDNRGTIVAEFEVTSAGTIIPHFRAEVAAAITLRIGSLIVIEKIA